MNIPRIVIDTSVLISALLSQRGAAYRLLMLSDSGLFETTLSVPLVAEHEAVAKRMLDQMSLALTDLDDILDYLCSVGICAALDILLVASLSDRPRRR